MVPQPQPQPQEHKTAEETENGLSHLTSTSLSLPTPSTSTHEPLPHPTNLNPTNHLTLKAPPAALPPSQAHAEPPPEPAVLPMQLVPQARESPNPLSPPSQDSPPGSLPQSPQEHPKPFSVPPNPFEDEAPQNEMLPPPPPDPQSPPAVPSPPIFKPPAPVTSTAFHITNILNNAPPERNSEFPKPQPFPQPLHPALSDLQEGREAHYLHKQHFPTPQQVFHFPVPQHIDREPPRPKEKDEFLHPNDFVHRFPPQFNPPPHHHTNQLSVEDSDGDATDDEQS
uniref:Uncharacterized protein n=1 Tax=Arcella intermedia TaxID=1963864 RepID=A0A6B2LC58_9EUKA